VGEAAAAVPKMSLDSPPGGRVILLRLFKGVSASEKFILKVGGFRVEGKELFLKVTRVWFDEDEDRT